MRASSSSSLRTVRRRSFTSSSVASAIAFATFSICSRAKFCALPGTLMAVITAFITRSSCIIFMTRGSDISFMPFCIRVFLIELIGAFTEATVLASHRDTAPMWTRRR